MSLDKRVAALKRALKRGKLAQILKAAGAVKSIDSMHPLLAEVQAFYADNKEREHGPLKVTHSIRPSARNYNVRTLERAGRKVHG